MDKLSYSSDEHLKEKLRDPAFKKLYNINAIKFKIGGQLVKYRIKHNLTQKQLGERIDVTQQQISKIESGDFSNLSTISKVLNAIGCNLEVKAPLETPKIIKRRHEISRFKPLPPPEKITYRSVEFQRTREKKYVAEFCRIEFRKSETGRYLKTAQDDKIENILLVNIQDNYS